jgi:hypothetical protein
LPCPVAHEVSQLHEKHLAAIEKSASGVETAKQRVADAERGFDPSTGKGAEERAAAHQALKEANQKHERRKHKHKLHTDAHGPHKSELDSLLLSSRVVERETDRHPIL